MADRITCPNPACGASSSGADHFIGRSVRCKKCGTPFIASQDGSLTIDDSAPIGRPVVPAFDIPNPFGKYRVLKKLGQGGMGAVYLARDDGLGRTVALKIPNRFDKVVNADILERFKREAGATAQLQHPNFCPVYEFGEFDGRPYLVMAYVPGATLASLVNRDAPMEPRPAARLVRKVALAMADAHEKGIVHRDLKPSNIMIDLKGEPIILDFGLVRRDDMTEIDTLTASGAMLGTLPYMPPEQVRGDRSAIGPASDIYSLGVILYELLTGRRPFDGPTHALVFAITQTEPPPASSHRPGLEAGLDALCAKAMSKAIEDRFGSMRDFAGELRPGCYRVMSANKDGRTTMTVRRAMTLRIQKPKVVSKLWYFGGIGIMIGGFCAGGTIKRSPSNDTIAISIVFTSMIIGTLMMLRYYIIIKLDYRKISCPICNNNWSIFLFKSYNDFLASGIYNNRPITLAGLKRCPYCDLSLDARMPEESKAGRSVNRGQLEAEFGDGGWGKLWQGFLIRLFGGIRR